MRSGIIGLDVHFGSFRLETRVVGGMAEDPQWRTRRKKRWAKGTAHPGPLEPERLESRWITIPRPVQVRPVAIASKPYREFPWWPETGGNDVK